MQNGVTQKEFYEAIEKVTRETNALAVTMTETKTLIRDYNGLRQFISDIDDRVQRLEDYACSKKEYREYMGWIVGCVATILAIISYFS
ncbi:hypothetical protein HZI73_25815 [Vallitalea pronyensis]|uniref:Uncharacterized protein n=1 Tax=Vallitalea pronyensis TaxID=1348613 RepID=A0A8J8MPT4_9FIRM|nr:hypothetical protein [Vallitalea pronyensis]QUI25501.1 hypothetical protein HZI73_25815 [Vallitalea pronyensis]